ncbi:hypothetical protein DHEL01_v211245 [Diaporthe helianthi]|uniref:Uncharacterized protein n=1 Tax=Diaporthe helianthi TaxID=158607 RepID=A0A2P5HJD9_DIAHE|nr:hypothetical protein DHEL01_v211245 [Diaporthe helianthi]
MGCGSSREAKPGHKKGHHHRRRRSSSQKRDKGVKKDFTQIHRCESNHLACENTSIVSPPIQLPDGSFMRIAWAPCGLEFAKDYVRERAADPLVSEYLSNENVPGGPQQGRARQGLGGLPAEPGAAPAHMSAAGEEYEMGSIPDPFPEDDMVYDFPMAPPPPDAYTSSSARHMGKKAGPKMVPGPFGKPVPAPDQDPDDMMYDDPLFDDPYAGEDIGAAPGMGPGDYMGYDFPAGPMPPPPAAAYHQKSNRVRMVPGPFGEPVPAPDQDNMMFDDPLFDDPYAGEYDGDLDMPYDGNYYPAESSARGNAAANATPGTGASGDNSGGSWPGSTIAPASGPPRDTYVANRHENFYRGDEFERAEFVDPPGVAVAQEERRPLRIATEYAATSENYNKIQYSMDYRKL